MPRTVRLGIDYGTSTSKMIFRDALAPGGEKAFCVLRNGAFRVSSSVKWNRSGIEFGIDPTDAGDGSTWFHSIKMRVAGEVTGEYARYCYGSLPPLPTGITARDLATGTLWFLMTAGRESIQKYLRHVGADVAIAITVGVPMSFFESARLRMTFLEIVRSAQWLFRNVPAPNTWRISVPDFVHLMREVDVEFVHEPVPNEDLRNWIRPEAESAMSLPVKSPSVDEGPYAEVDIGAGTTHASIFSILPRFNGQRWVKERLAFFGAYSEPAGMDSIDVAIAHQAGQDWCALRGKERRFLVRAQGRYAGVIERIREAYLMAWRRAAPMLNYAERIRFRNHHIFVTGGGSLVPEITEILKEHPEHYGMLQLRQLDSPNDLWAASNQRISPADVPFVAAAYGLSFDALELPAADTPDTMERSVPLPIRPFIPYEDR